MEDAELALAIANSLAEAEQAVPSQTTTQTIVPPGYGNDQDDGWQEAISLSLMQASADRLAASQAQVDNDEPLEDVHVAIQVQDSCYAAVQHHQLRNDAELAADLATISALTETEESERQTVAHVAATTAFMEHQQTECQQGTWDCPHCTCRSSRPYQARCQACGQAAPDSVLVFCDVPAALRFGVELELIVPQGTRDGFTCQWIATELTRLGVPCDYAGYTHRVSEQWKIVTDASLQSDRNDLCCELVSPILVGEDGLADLRLLLESVRKVGIAINQTCGFHVHVDAESGAMASLAGLERLVQCFCAVERAFDLLVTSSNHYQRKANRHKYCQSNTLAFGTLSNKKRWNRIASCRSVRELVSLVNPQHDRYHKLNVTNVVKENRGRTCEFRQHGGVSELLEAEAWVRLLLRFCDFCSRQSPASLECLLPDSSTPDSELQALFQLVDCPGLQAFYLLDRHLFRNSNQANGNKKAAREWKCMRCKRCFRDSRSLSQHARDTGHFAS